MIKPIAVVYANLIDRGLRTEESIPNVTVRKQAIAVVAVRKLRDGKISFAQLCSAEGSEDTGDMYYGIYTSDTEVAKYIDEYAKTLGVSDLLK